MGKLPSAAKTGGCKGALADRDAGRIERGEASLAGGEAQAAAIDFSQVSTSGMDARSGPGAGSRSAGKPVRMDRVARISFRA